MYSEVTMKHHIVVAIATSGLKDVLEDATGRIGLVLLAVTLLMFGLGFILHLKGDFAAGRVCYAAMWLAGIAAFVLLFVARKLLATRAEDQV